MKKKSKPKSAAVPKVDPYLEGLIAKLLERLVSLETKMDTVISQTAARSSHSLNSSKPIQNPAPVKPSTHRDRTLYEAVCADCHKVCEVPFKPSEDRAVYCKECFARRKSGGAGKHFPVLTPVALAPKTPSASWNPPAAVPENNGRVDEKTKKKNPAKKNKKRR